MSEYSGPKTGVNDFDASRWRDFYANLFGIGVIKGARVQGAAGGDLAVTSPSGLNVTVATGAACVKGFLYASDTAAVAKVLGAADPSLPRIDTLCVQWNYASGVPTCVIAVKAGTPASSPVAPTLTQNDTTYELALADCRVNAGATTIASVTDRRTYAQAVIPFTIGHASGNIPISDGTVNTNLNADMVDGAHAGNAAGNVALANGTVVATLNADLLDGLNSTALVQTGTHNTVTPLKISAGTALPGTLDANEAFLLFA